MLTGIANIVDVIFDMVWSVANYVVQFPLLLISFGIFVVGGVIGLAYRLTR